MTALRVLVGEPCARGGERQRGGARTASRSARRSSAAAGKGPALACGDVLGSSESLVPVAAPLRQGREDAGLCVEGMWLCAVVGAAAAVLAARAGGGGGAAAGDGGVGARGAQPGAARGRGVRVAAAAHPHRSEWALLFAPLKRPCGVLKMASWCSRQRLHVFASNPAAPAAVQHTATHALGCLPAKKESGGVCLRVFTRRSSRTPSDDCEQAQPRRWRTMRSR